MKIAIVKLSALGDIVHAMVVLQFIKKNNHKITIDWIVEENYRQLVENSPDINEVHSINLKAVKKNKSIRLLFLELTKLRKIGRYDLVIDMQGLIKSAICASLVPSSSTIGFSRASSREKFASLFYSKSFKIDYKKNIIKRNFELVSQALTLPYKVKDLQNKDPFLKSSKKYEFSHLSDSKKNIILIAGASNKSKIYPAIKFSQLTQIIDANFIIIWGNSKERLIAEQIKHLSPKVNISESLTIDALISIISQVDLVIGSDTGPTHLAWALEIPSITLFGSTPGYRNTFETDINKVLESESIVNPLKINKSDYSIKNIEVQEIVKIATLFL